LPLNSIRIDILNLIVETKKKEGWGARRFAPFLFCLVGCGFRDVAKKRVEDSSRASGSKPEAAETESSEAQQAERIAGKPKKKKKQRPVPCIQRYTDREFRREFRQVCTTFLEKAKDGSTAHTKLLLEIGKSGERKATKRPGGRSLSEMLLDELKRRQDEREAAADKARADETQTNAKAGNDEDAASVEDGEKE
jgi:hypothetical protein